MTTATAVVQIRQRDESVTVEQLQSLTLGSLDEAIPWRRFRSYRGQRHYSGSYWSATMGSLVGYESRLELANLLCEDFDPTTVWILSQPFLLEGLDGSRKRRHVPDYLVERIGGRACVIDVKPAELLADPKIAAALKWSALMIESIGWEYVVLSEPEPVRLGNIRFLAGYRRAFQFVPVEVEAVRLAIQEPMTIGQACRLSADQLTEPDYARGVVLHLLWTGRLMTDLSVPLASTAILEPAL
ncbi:TnsA-like heteromeric transposase endonuclease subunit [Microbacterium lacticum]